jgi:hypothetical protein
MNPNLVLGSETYSKEVTKMMMLLLAKMAKVAWLDDPEIKNEIVPELTKMINFNDPRHKLIGLQAIDQLLVEMTYLTKMKNLSMNRRISLSFRDTALYDIYTNNLQYCADLARQIENELKGNSPHSLTIVLDSTSTCLETYLKCLQFDFIAILLNETLEEPSLTNVSKIW